jgi:hypothetical protein
MKSAAEIPTEPPLKKVRTSIWDYADHMNECHTNHQLNNDDIHTTDIVVNNFLTLPTISRSESPLIWWKQNCTAYPLLAQLARVHLGAPPTSVDSERLFSVAADIHTPNRNRLIPKNVEKLVFLKYNLQNFEY